MVLDAAEWRHLGVSGELYETTARELTARWGVPAPGAAPQADEETDWSLLRDALEERIVALLKDDFGKLTTAMYLLDISEEHFKTAMSQPGLEAKARALAELVLARETERMRTRLYYSKQKRL